MKERRLNRRLRLIEMSGGCCKKCGSKNNLEFNHKNREEKNFVLSGHNLDKSWDKIIEEWEKTELLCSKCHLEHTRKLYKDKKITVWNSMKGLPYLHGTVRTYQEKKCKCEECKMAKKLYRNKKISYTYQV